MAESRVFRSTIGEAFADVGESIARGRQRKRDKKERDKIRGEDVAARDRRAALLEKQVASEDADRALNNLFRLSEFVPEGTTIGDNALATNLATRAFPELSDVDRENLSNLQLRPETLKGVIDTLGIKMVEADPTGAATQAAVNAAIGAGSRTTAELQADDARANLLNEAFVGIANDPESLDIFARNQLGLPPEITIDVPGIGPKTFDSEGAARIWAQLHMNQQNIFSAAGKIGAEQQENIGKIFREQLKLANIAIGPGFESQVVSAYSASLDGKFPPGETPLDKLYNSGSESDKAAIQLFVGTIDLTENSFLDTLAASGPEGAATAFTLQLGETISQFVPKEDVPKVLGDLLPQLNRGISFDKPFLRKRRFEFQREAPPAEPTANGVNQQFDLDTQTGLSVVQSGQMTIEQLRELDPNVAARVEEVLSAGTATGSDAAPVDTAANVPIEELVAQFRESVSIRDAAKTSSRNLSKGGKERPLAENLGDIGNANKAAREARRLLRKIRAIDPELAIQLTEEIDKRNR